MKSPRPRVKSSPRHAPPGRPARSAAAMASAGPAGRAEGSIAATLLRTLALVALTVGLMGLCRIWGPARAAIVWVAGTSTWQSLYGWLRLDNGLQREQLLLVGIAASCFALALVLQGLGLVVLRRVRRARARG